MHKLPEHTRIEQASVQATDDTTFPCMLASARTLTMNHLNSHYVCLPPPLCTVATWWCCSFYFPWLAERLRPDAMPHLNQRRSEDSPERAPLSLETAALIRAHYRVEMDLYDFAMQVHTAQVERVRAAQAVLGEGAGPGGP